MVILVLENFVSEGKALRRLNIFLHFPGEKRQFQKKITSKKKNHIFKVLSLCLTHKSLSLYPHIRMEKGRYYWTARKGSQVPDCGVGDEFSMGFIKKSPRYA